MSPNEAMIKKMRSWYTKTEFEKNDAGCPVTEAMFIDLVLTNNSQRRIAFWGMVLITSLPRIDVWQYTGFLFIYFFHGGIYEVHWN